MRSLLENIISINPQNTSINIVILGCALWLVMWLVMVIDIFQSSRSGFWKLTWTIVCSVPLIGGIIYAFYMLSLADWSSTFFLRKVSASRRKK